MNERLKYEGRLSIKEKEAESLKLQMEGLIKAIRDELDPYEKIDDLDIPRAFELMSDLAGKSLEYQELAGEIRRLKKDLGK